MIWVRYWRELLLVIFMSTTLWGGYKVIYNHGVSSVEEKYAQKIEDHNRQVLEQVLKVQDLSGSLAKANRQQAALLSKDLQQILTKLNQKPLYKIDEVGKCTPSQEFLEGFNDVINSSNKR